MQGREDPQFPRHGCNREPPSERSSKNLGLGLGLSQYRCDADESSQDSHESNPVTSAGRSREIKDSLDPPTTYRSLFFPLPFFLPLAPIKFFVFVDDYDN